MPEVADRKSVTVPRVMLVGAGHGVGLSTVVIGLLVALKRAGVSVAAGSVAPSLVQSTHQRRICARLAHTLDPWMLTAAQLAESLARLSSGAEMVVLEGQGGVFDSKGEDACFKTDAALAAELKAPLVLVVSAEEYCESIAALIKGFASFSAGCKFAGVIVNKVRSAEQGARIKKVLSGQSAIRLLGMIPFNEELSEILEREDWGRLNPSLLPRNALVSLGEMFQSAIAPATIREIADTAAGFSVTSEALRSSGRRCRIAVADDAAFHLTVQDNLDLIRRAGAELVAFSPLADGKLPSRTAGVYLPGGYLHLYAGDLNNNTLMRQAMLEFGNAGGVIYAEGAAVGYLCRGVTPLGNEPVEMVGLIPAVAGNIDDGTKITRMSYGEIEATEETVFTSFGDRFRGIVDSRWVIQCDEEVTRCFQLHDRTAISRGDDKKQRPPILTGFSPVQNIIAAPVHAHWGSAPHMAQLFVDLVAGYAQAHGLLQQEQPAEAA